MIPLVPGWLLTEGGAWCSGGVLFVLDEVLGIFSFLWCCTAPLVGMYIYLSKQMLLFVAFL